MVTCSGLPFIDPFAKSFNCDALMLARTSFALANVAPWAAAAIRRCCAFDFAGITPAFYANGDELTGAHVAPRRRARTGNAYVRAKASARSGLATPRFCIESFDSSTSLFFLLR